MRIVYLTVVFAMLAFGMLDVPTKGQAPGEASAGPAKVYPDSLVGIEEQFTDLLAISRSGDQEKFREALDSLRIPDSDAWVLAHFAPEQVGTVRKEYSESLESSKSHVSWVMGTFGKYPDFGLKVQNSLTPGSHSSIGIEGLLPTLIYAVKVENYRFSTTSSSSDHGPPSWVSSFTYIDGQFRMVGGTFPFWAEPSNALRGPMTLPAATIHGRNVQGAAFRKDTIGPGIDAIVHVRIELGDDGKIKNMNVLSGDPQFAPDAQEYLKNAEFPRLPDGAMLTSMKAEWDMEVVFFPPNLYTLSPKN